MVVNGSRSRSTRSTRTRIDGGFLTEAAVVVGVGVVEADSSGTWLAAVNSSKLLTGIRQRK